MLKPLAAAAVALSLFASVASAQDAPPKDNVGVSASPLGEVPLAGEFTDIGNRALRMRVITVEPNGIIGLHSHANRPSVEYVLSGTAVEVRGDKSTDMKAGSQMIADHTVEHYWKNTGTDPLVILAVDIYQPAAK
jgi:mannose-6-phosphate isomerase-like protein (cupin superfamily)